MFVYFYLVHWPFLVPNCIFFRGCWQFQGILKPLFLMSSQARAVKLLWLQKEEAWNIVFFSISHFKTRWINDFKAIIKSSSAGLVEACSCHKTWESPNKNPNLRSKRLRETMLSQIVNFHILFLTHRNKRKLSNKVFARLILKIQSKFNRVYYTHSEYNNTMIRNKFSRCSE